MGRIRTKIIKNMSKRLVKKYPEKFSNNFENNKKVLCEMNIMKDKPVRNKVAGYIVTVVEKKNAQLAS